METKEMAKVDEARVEKAVAEFKPNPAFLVASSMLPKSYKDVMELAVIMAKSGIVPKDLIGRPEACAVAIMYGLELGVSPQLSCQNIMVVNGRPSVWGDLFKALLVGSGKVELFDEDPAHIALKQGFGRCHLIRKKEFGGGEVEHIFSIEDAKRAKLWIKQGPWQDYPGRMLQMRPRSWAGRDLFSDVLKGLQMREEVADYEIINPPLQMPTRSKASGTVVDASIVENVAKSVKQENAQPGQSLEAERGSQEQQPTGEIANEGQEPGNAAGDVQDGDFKISPERRKELFKAWTDAKIPIDQVKLYVKEQFGIDNTSDLTNHQAITLELWINSHPK